MTEMTFHTYDLQTMSKMPEGVYALSDGLLPEMAKDLGYAGLGITPNADAIKGFIGHAAPHKELQRNIASVQDRLSELGKDALTTTCEWAERSGVLLPQQRSFVSPAIELPDTKQGTQGFQGDGVARWMLRRADVALHPTRPKISVMHLAAGTRTMGLGEHQSVQDYANENGHAPTAAQFMSQTIRPKYDGARIPTVLYTPESGEGTRVAHAALQGMDLEAPIVVVGNAPSAIQSAGQFREIARSLKPDFDDDGTELFVVSDGIEVARNNEGPETHQNSYSLIGAILRNALFLHNA